MTRELIEGSGLRTSDSLSRVLVWSSGMMAGAENLFSHTGNQGFTHAPGQAQRERIMVP